MAGRDYKSCDQCGCKTFYDVNLDYDFKENDKRTCLHNTGDHKALCSLCADKYELVVYERVKLNINKGERE